MTTLFTDEAAFKLAARYFRLPVLSVRPWSFGNVEIAPPPDFKRAIVSLREARTQTELMSADASNAVYQYLDADTKLLNADRAEALFYAGFFVDAGTFDLPAAGQVGVDQLRGEQQRRRAESLRFLDRYEDMIRLRMGTTLRLLRIRHVIENISTGGLREPTGPSGVFRFVTRLYASLYTMDQARSHFETLRHAFVKAFILLYNLNAQPENRKLIEEVRPCVTQVHDELILVRAKLSKTRQPFDADHVEPKRSKKKTKGHAAAKSSSPGSTDAPTQAKASMTMADFLLPDIAPLSQVDQLMLQTEQWLNGFAYLHHRMLAHLAAISGKVEVAVGLPPLPPVAPPATAKG